MLRHRSLPSSDAAAILRDLSRADNPIAAPNLPRALS